MQKYSIILPVYNGGAYIKECVNSILAQTLDNFNLIILDNNSDDETFQWLKSLNDKRIIIYPSEIKLPIVENWARIKDIQKNEFITLIGHDDILLPNYLEEMDKLIETHPDASLYQAHFNFIGSKGEFIRPCMPMDKIQYGHEFLAAQMSKTMDSMGTGYMMRSKDFDNLGGMPVNYPNLIFADYELWVKLCSIRYKATTPIFCFNYRLHNSVSKLTDGNAYAQAFEQYVFFLYNLQQNNDQVRNVIEHYGYDYLMFFCESLSHRILKTRKRSKTESVEAFLEKCVGFAKLLFPNRKFEPLKIKRIKIAKQLDANSFTRSIFYVAKKILK